MNLRMEGTMKLTNSLKFCTRKLNAQFYIARGYLNRISCYKLYDLQKPALFKMLTVNLGLKEHSDLSMKPNVYMEEPGKNR